MCVFSRLRNTTIIIGAVVNRFTETRIGRHERRPSRFYVRSARCLGRRYRQRVINVSPFFRDTNRSNDGSFDVPDIVSIGSFREM